MYSVSELVSFADGDQLTCESAMNSDVCCLRSTVAHVQWWHCFSELIQ